MARKKEGKTVHHNIARVQNCIEKCFMLYMNKAEVMNTVITQAHENPDVAEIVWHRLETQNPEFFKAYNLMVLVKQQMVEFNRLLSEQAELMRKTGLSVMTKKFVTNGYDVSPTNQSSMWCAEQITRPVENANLQPPKLTSPNAFRSGLPIQSCMQGTLDVFTHGGMIDFSPNMVFPQNSNVPQALNGTIVETGPLYNGNLPFNFPPHNSFFESRPLMGDANVSSFNSADTNTQPLNGSILDGFGFLDQNPQDFVLPELAADFSDLLESNYLLESNCISQFPSSKDANNLVNFHGDIDANLLMDSHGDMDARQALL